MWRSITHVKDSNIKHGVKTCTFDLTRDDNKYITMCSFSELKNAVKDSKFCVVCELEVDPSTIVYLNY